MARYPGLSPLQWWQEVPLTWSEALHSFIPVLDAQDALQGVSVARVGRMWGEQGRKATAPWLQVHQRRRAGFQPAVPRYTHSLADEVADWRAAWGSPCGVFLNPLEPDLWTIETTGQCEFFDRG